MKKQNTVIQCNLFKEELGQRSSSESTLVLHCGHHGQFRCGVSIDPRPSQVNFGRTSTAFSKGITSVFRLALTSVCFTFDGSVCRQKEASSYSCHSKLLQKAL